MKVVARWTGLEPEGREAKANCLAFVGPHDGGDVHTKCVPPNVKRSGWISYIGKVSFGKSMLEVSGAVDGTRTRDLRRDRAAF